MIIVVMHINGIPLQFLRPLKPSIANFRTRNPISLSYGPSTYGETGQQDNFKYDKEEISSSENTSSHSHSVLSPKIPGLTVGQAGNFNQFPNPALAEHCTEEKIIDASLATQISGHCPPIPPPSPPVRLTGKALSSAIEKEYSPRRLLHLVATYKEALTPVQICTAFHRIGKRSSKLRGIIKASLRKDEIVIWLAARIDDCLPLYEAQALTNVAWAHTQLAHGSDGLLDRVEECGFKRLDHFRSLEVIIMIHSLAKAGTGSRLIQALIERHVAGQLTKFEARQMKEVVWAMAKMELQLWETFQEIAEHLPGRLLELEIGHLANIAWAYSKAGVDAPLLFRYIIPRLLALLPQALPQDLSNLAWAYAKQGVKHDDLMQRLADVSIQTAPRMSPQSLSNVTWSFAMLAVHRPDLMAAVEREVCTRAPDFAPQGLANVAWAFSSLSHYSHPLFSAVSTQARLRLPLFETESLGALALSFASIAHRDPALMAAIAEETLQRLRVGAESSLHKCSAVNVAWALALTATYGSPSLFPLLRQRMGATLDWSSAQLCQLFQVELALQLEAPAVAGMPTWGPDSSAGAYLQDLWLGGHLRHLAKVAWERESAEDKRQVSKFQREVAATLDQLGICHLAEYRDGEYSIDMAVVGGLGGLRVAVEADGPTHFAVNERRPLGKTRMKRRMLEKRGWRVVQVPWFDWEVLPNESAKCAYMEEALRSCLGGREAFQNFKSLLSSPHVSVQWGIGDGRGDGEGQWVGQSDELELQPPPRAPGGVVRRERGMGWEEREEEGIGSREEEVIGTRGDVVSLAESEAEAFVSEGDKGGSEGVSREAVEKKRGIMKRGEVLKQLKVGRRGGSKVELLRQVAVERQVASGKGSGEKAPIAED